jgi:hypothetical protein
VCLYSTLLEPVLNKQPVTRRARGDAILLRTHWRLTHPHASAPLRRDRKNKMDFSSLFKNGGEKKEKKQRPF